MSSNTLIHNLVEKALENLPFEPLDRQILLVKAAAEFICAPATRDVFIINGHAGTGKTSILGAIVKACQTIGIKTIVLAPTGRAAKVAASFCGTDASTIHKRIYRGDSNVPSFTGFFPIRNSATDTLFIVDEASMIADDGSNPLSVLPTLLRHVLESPGCKIIFSGDTAQLPPIGQTSSPAMNPKILKALGLNPIMFNLTDAVRQAAQSGILYHATIIRRRIEGSVSKPLKLRVSKFNDIEVPDPYDILSSISSSWSEVGMEETVVITRSNYRAAKFNAGIRHEVIYADNILESGERIIIAKNNYFWTKNDKDMPFIANGETAIVEWMGKKERIYGHNFCEVELRFPSTGKIITAKLNTDTLLSDSPSLTTEETNALYAAILESKEGNMNKKISQMKTDPFFNAVQAKYAYCITCHKAQGGQWKHVYIDLSGIDINNLTEEFYRWFYTAITRATEKVFFLNPTFLIL